MIADEVLCANSAGAVGRTVRGAVGPERMTSASDLSTVDDTIDQLLGGIGSVCHHDAHLDPKWPVARGLLLGSPGRTHEEDGR